VHDVLKTLYSPIKAFEEIAKKPDVRAPLLILALILIVTAGLHYVLASKVPIEIATPENDEWTESLNLWTSNGQRSNSSDSLVGNYSVMSSVANNACIWMRLTDIGPINCSGDENYKRLSFRIKWAHQNRTFPDSEATLKLFLNGENDNYLTLNLKAEMSNSSDVWHNSTVDVGPENLDWNYTEPSDWEYITGVEFKLAWSAPANLTMKIDDLYFGRYVPALEALSLNQWLIEPLLFTGLGFFLSWGIYGGLLLLVLKIFGGKIGSWKESFLVLGYLFSVTVIYNVVITLLAVILPAWPYSFVVYFGLLGNVWIAALSAIAMRSLYGLSWKKAIGISVMANLAVFLLNPLMLVWPFSWVYWFP